MTDARDTSDTDLILILLMFIALHEMSVKNRNITSKM